MVTTRSRSRSLTALVVVAAMLVPISVLSGLPAHAVTAVPEIEVVEDGAADDLLAVTDEESLTDAEQPGDTAADTLDEQGTVAAAEPPLLEPLAVPLRPVLSSVTTSPAPHDVPAVIPGEMVTAVPGQQLFALAVGIGLADVGRFEFTAPSHTTIRGMQHQGLGHLAYTLSEDGRTARSVRTDVNLIFGVFMHVTIDDDAPLGTRLDDGSMRLVSPGGQVLAQGTFGFEILAAPEILAHPQDVSVVEGEPVMFTSAYAGTDAPTSAQWQFSVDGGESWSYVPGGATDPDLTIERATLDMDGWQYRVRYTNASGSRWSEHAHLSVAVARPVVSEHPGDVVVRQGGAATLSGAFTGTDAPTTAQWQFSTDGGATFNYVPGGATQQSLTLDAVTREMDGWQYRVRFTNAAGSAWSDAATLRVTFGIPAASGEAAPGESVELRIYDPESVRLGNMTITAPTGTTIESARHNGGSSGPFVISEDGKAATGVRTSWGGGSITAWVTLRVDDDAVPGSVLDDGTAHIVDADVVVASGILAVTVTGEIEILEHPADLTVDVGTTAELTAPVSGHGVTTQWQVSTDEGATWVDVDGETGTTLTLETTTPEMSRSWYRAVHTNSVGQVVTDHAVLLVRVAPHFVTHPQPEFFGVPGTLAFFAGWASDNIDGMPLTWEYSADGETWEPYEDGIFPGSPAGFNMLQLQPVLAEMDGVRFRAVAENHLGRAMSDPGLLTVSADPVISAHPADVRTLVGHDATFSASTPAVSPHRTQQWQERTAGGEWTDIPGATDPTYATGPTTLDMDQREYRIVFTNRHGSTASEHATLTVRASVPATVSVTPTVRLVDQIR